MAKKRRSFTKEYKAEAVRVAREGAKVGKLPGAIAKELGLPATSLRAWMRQMDVDDAHAPGGALTTTEREELAALRKETRVLRMERDFLKKAAAFFGLFVDRRAAAGRGSKHGRDSCGMTERERRREAEGDEALDAVVRADGIGSHESQLS